MKFGSFLAASLLLFTTLVVIDAVIPPEKRVVVFSAGESGYFCIKIPVILKTKNNTLLAFGEARHDSCSDFAGTDIVVKKSYDSGQTWSNLVILVTNSSSAEKNVVGNVAPVVERGGGGILMPFCRNNKEVFLTTSNDNGESWSKPVKLESAAKNDWKWVGTGPPAGLQLESGRILIPSYHETLAHEDGTFSKGHFLTSDDLGQTWEIRAEWGGLTHFPNEAQAVDLGNNTVLVNARGIGTRRLEAVSFDGGNSIDARHVRVMRDLPESIDGCEGSMVRYPPSPLDDEEWKTKKSEKLTKFFEDLEMKKKSNNNNNNNNNNNEFSSSSALLFFSNPHEGRLYRYNMSLLVSDDGGGSWIECRQIDAGPSGYSALVVMEDSSVAILYESSVKKEVIFTPDTISFETVWVPGCGNICGCEISSSISSSSFEKEEKK